MDHTLLPHGADAGSHNGTLQQLIERLVSEILTNSNPRTADDENSRGDRGQRCNIRHVPSVARLCDQKSRCCWVRFNLHLSLLGNSTVQKQLLKHPRVLQEWFCQNLSLYGGADFFHYYKFYARFRTVLERSTDSPNY